MVNFLMLKLKNVTKMKKTIIIVIILISANCFSQTLNDTIPYLKSKILPQYFALSEQTIKYPHLIIYHIL